MNIAAAILVFREGLEGALIVAIMLGYLRKVGRLDRQLSVWAGAILAALMAVGFTVVLQLINSQFDYPAKGIYEGLTSLFAVVMLTYMIFWMSRQARYIKGSLEHDMKTKMTQGAAWGLFVVAFLTVAREGVETALFLSASAFQSSGMAALVGGLIGLAAALAVAWAVYVAGMRLQLRTFFRITSLLLVIFAAAIFRYAIGELGDVGWIPAIIEPLWDTSALIPNSSGLGSILQALTGYVSQPSLSEVVGYFGYLIITGSILLRPAKQSAQLPAPPVAAPASTEATEAAVISPAPAEMKPN